MQVTNTESKLLTSLKTSFEFNIVFKDGLKVQHENLGIYAVPMDRFQHALQKSRRHNRRLESNTLVGFSINRKVAKAVKRNLIKRRIKAILLMLKHEGGLGGLALAFVPRKGILEWDFHALKAHIDHSLERLKQLMEAKLANKPKHKGHQNPPARNHKRPIESKKLPKAQK